MTVTKTKKPAFKKTQTKQKGQSKQSVQRKLQGVQLDGPFVVIQAPSAYEILSLIRDSINVAIDEMTMTPPPQLSGFPFVPAINSLIKDWHQPQYSDHVPDPQHREHTPHSKQYRPVPATSAPEQKTWRARVVEWITDYVGPREAGPTGEDYRQAYKGAYRQLMLRYGVDVVQRARNFANTYKKAEQPVPEGNEPMDFVERLGLTEELFKIVCEIYPLYEVNPAFRSEPVLAGAQG